MIDKDNISTDKIQKYYDGKYISYQREVIKRNDNFLEDTQMIKKFISELAIKNCLIDIGSGDCRCFSLFEKKIDHYYAIDTSSVALSLAPKNIKLSTINKDIFKDKIDVLEQTSPVIDIAFFSFFLSHFSDSSIQLLFKKIENIPSILVIDSFWGSKHKEKYITKDLKYVKRMTSKNDFIHLPKRFFEYDDIQNLAKLVGYTISRFDQGLYWFICTLEKKPL